MIISVAGIETERVFASSAPLPHTEHDVTEALAIASLLCRSPTSVGALVKIARAEASAPHSVACYCFSPVPEDLV
jgi:hypothetical protein